MIPCKVMTYMKDKRYAPYMPIIPTQLVGYADGGYKD